MADDLLQKTVADRHAAGDGDMGADRARKLDEAEEAGPAAVDFGDAPDEAHDLGDDEHDVENRARADRGDQRNALGGLGDFALRPLVERPEQRALGDVDEVAPVDDRARRVLDFSPRARRLRPMAIERHELADKAARRGAIVGRARLSERDMHFRDPRLARHRQNLARRDANEADEEHDAKGKPDNPERLSLGEQPLDEVRRPQAERERDEAREPRPGEAGEAEPRARDEARLLRGLDLSSASSIGAAAPPAGIGSCCERMTASGASGAGLSSTATRASSSRKARGRGGRSLMRDGPRSGIAARGRAGSAARARRARSAAGGSARTASRCRPRARRSRRPRRSHSGRPAIRRERRPLRRRRRTPGRRSSRPFPARR